MLQRSMNADIAQNHFAVKICEPETQSISACANVTAALLAHGYSAADTRKIMGENWLNLYQTVWK